jgi:hypothetical protein
VGKMKHNKYSKLKIPKCPICKEEMYLDDIDYNFDGNQDNYFICKNDGTSCYQKVRYGKVIYEEESEEK